MTEPTTLTVNATSASYGGTTTLSGTLTDADTALPVSNEPIVFAVGTQTCTGTTLPTGVATCTVPTTEAEGSYTVSGSFTGDSTQPVPLTGSSNLAALHEYAGHHDADLHRRHLCHQRSADHALGEPHERRLRPVGPVGHVHPG